MAKGVSLQQRCGEGEGEGDGRWRARVAAGRGRVRGAWRSFGGLAQKTGARESVERGVLGDGRLGCRAEERLRSESVCAESCAETGGRRLESVCAGRGWHAKAHAKAKATASAQAAGNGDGNGSGSDSISGIGSGSIGTGPLGHWATGAGAARALNPGPAPTQAAGDRERCAGPTPSLQRIQCPLTRISAAAQETGAI